MSNRIGTSPRKPRSCVPWPTSKARVGLALAGLAAVDQGDGVFDLQAAELLGHRRLREHLDVEEAVLAGCPWGLSPPDVDGAGLRDW